MHDGVSLLAALTLIALAFGVLRLWQQRTPPPSAELVRKAAHMSTGVIAATFPWLFRSTGTGLTLCFLALLAMIGMRLMPGLRRTIGRVTGSVERQSWGELCFPAAVACVWVLSEKDPILFVVPVLLLTFGDAAAALVGATFGRHKFRTTEGHKSVEGSLAFLAVSTAATFLALITLTPQLDVIRALLIATLLASLLMAFEAIAWRGLDNLLVPVMAFVLLQLYLKLDSEQLAVRLAAFSLILMWLVAIRGRRTLTGEGVLAAALFLYIAWALGGWPWLVPPTIVVLAAPWLPRNPNVPSVAVHGVFPVIALSATGLVFLGVHALNGPDVWRPYVATFAAALSMVTCIQLHPNLLQVPRKGVLVLSVVLGVALVVGPAALLTGLSLRGAGNLLVLAFATSLVACSGAFMPALNRLAGDRWMWLLRGTSLSIGSACAAGLNKVVSTLP
jgi:phytol kinase